MNQSNQYFSLDQFDERYIKKWKQHAKDVAKYYWDHYRYFEHQRSLILSKLKNALARNSKSFEFSMWHRAVSGQFNFSPLSAEGSRLNCPGGRFNIGNINPLKFSPFSSLYLAEDRETAYKEKYGLFHEQKSSGLTAEELALTSYESVSFFLVKGKIGDVLDITTSDVLEDFFSLIKTIHLPPDFTKEANKLNIPPLRHIKSRDELYATLLDPHWRNLPMQVDIPANSQIFGQIADVAGLQAILYPSKMSSSKRCLAIFPKNFAESTDFIQLEGAISPKVEHPCLNAVSYANFL